MSSSLDELGSKISADVQAVNEAIQQVESSKAACEELSSSFAGLGNESIPGVLAQAKAKLEEAANQGASQVKNLEEAQAAVEAAKQA
ncbi:MAG TPA: hypothetical protein H9902_11400 [Candidatus Stackebrandtia faecavium]|nr:hypothetical protein [Candidatus Stackebrandtia faecavium]